MVKIKKLGKKILMLVIMAAFLNLPLNVSSEKISEEIINKASSALVNLKLMIGDEKGNLKLNDNLTRCEFVTLVNRMMAYNTDNHYNDEYIPFTDVKEKHWAYSNIVTAVSYGLINGYTDNTFRPDNNVTFVEAQAVLLRALGYQNQITKSWPDGVIEKSTEINLNKNLDLDRNKQITRGEASVLIYNALTIDFFK
ncbi:MAG: S-layer homology domain-containing protein [Clostridiaceae bacterium]|jgi:hypothetical protein|nr:S-layer homology domain-containing protein [Clostridiaceae bacterium]